MAKLQRWARTCRHTSSGFAYASGPRATTNGEHFSVIFIKATAAPRAVAGRGESSAMYDKSRARTSALTDGGGEGLDRPA